MIRVFKPKLNIKDKLSVHKFLRNGDISGTSSVINEFEKKLATTFNRKYAVAVCNGSVALEVALKLFNFEEDDEIIVPSFTIISCLSAIIRANAKPVFCDVDKFSWNMSLEDVQKVFSKKTKAILMVHTYGLAAQSIEIEEFCRNNNLILIEDSAEAHGQIYSGRKCGSFGNVSTLSFYANKHITTGEGGAILIDDEEKYLHLKRLINLDFTEPNRFNHSNLYWNYRIGGLQAALGISQIDNMKKNIEMKITQGEYYSKLLKDHQQYVQLPLYENFGVKNHYWVYGIVLHPKVDRNILRTYLLQGGVETREFFWPLHLQKALNLKNKKINLPNSENLGLRGLYLPMGSHINKKKQSKIVNFLIQGIKMQKVL